jgi:outer membrane protein TolC
LAVGKLTHSFLFTLFFVRFTFELFGRFRKSLKICTKIIPDMDCSFKAYILRIKGVLLSGTLILLLIFPLLTRVEAQPEANGVMDLGKCIEMGLKNNPGFQSSGYLVDETKAKVVEAFSGYYPTVSASSDADAFSKNNGSQRYQNLTTGITLSYNIYQGNKMKSLYSASKDNYQATLYQHEANRQDLIFGIIQAYYLTLQSERLLRSAEEAVKNSRLHLDFARAKFNAGMATRSDILKSEVEVSNADLDRIKAANALLAARGNLNQLLGLSSDSETKLFDDLSDINHSGIQSFDSLVNEALNARTEIKKYESLINAQQKYIVVAKSGYLPSLSANANYNFAGPAVSSMQENWWLGMTLSVPLFKGFSTKARVVQEEYAFKGLEKDYEQLKNHVSREVWNSWLAVKESVERISASAKALESARENLSLAEGEYKEGVGSVIQLTDAQTTFVTAEQNYIQALSGYKISYAELERTTGR